MSKIHLVIPDPHATPRRNNKRAELIGKLINDVKPDVVINLGDTADMESLCTYDRGKKSFIGRTYQKDIEVHGDFQERLWHTVRHAKKRMPYKVTLIGNHEQRIDRAIEVQPELEGIISYKDLCLDKFYDETIHYEGSTPGSCTIDGITYAHYLVSGVSGRPISGDNIGATILTKKFTSCVVGHNHTLSWGVRSRQDGSKIMGLCAGTMTDYDPSYAGDASKLWWRGVCILHNVENGVYDLETVSLNKLRKVYG